MRTKTTLKAAFIGTGMQLVEATRTKTYFNNKILRKVVVPQLGLYRLAYHAQKSDPRVNVKVFDPGLQKPKHILSQIKKGHFDIIGFSPILVAYGDDVKWMNRVYQAAKDNGSNPLFIAGGNEASNNSDNIFKLMPWVDFCVYGYGEPVIEAIIRRTLAPGRSPLNSINLNDIPGLIPRDAPDTFIKPAKISPEEFQKFSLFAGENIPYKEYWNANLDIIPPHLRHLPENSIKVARIFTVSYCPHFCGFCSAHIIGRDMFGRKAAYLSPEDVMLLIQENVRLHQPEAIFFNDENIFISKNHMDRGKKLLRMIIEQKTQGLIPQNLKFYGQTRITDVDPEMLELIHQAGFVYLSFGVESFADEVLLSPEFNKGYGGQAAFDTVSDAIGKASVVNANLILFPPNITRKTFIETAEQTIELIKQAIHKKAKLSLNNYLTLEAFAGSPVERMPKSKSWPKKVMGVTGADGDSKGQTAYFLPTDEEMRALVDDNKLMQRFNEIMAGLTADQRWPKSTVSRSLGINAIATFMAAYDLLQIQDSKISFEQMRELIFELIKTFHVDNSQEPPAKTTEDPGSGYASQSGQII